MLFKGHTDRHLCLKEPHSLLNGCGHLALDHCQGLSIDYVPDFKQGIIHESPDSSNRRGLSNNLAEFTTGNVQKEKRCRANTFPTHFLHNSFGEESWLIATLRGLWWCEVPSATLRRLRQHIKRFCCGFRFQSLGGDWEGTPAVLTVTLCSS